MARQPISPWLLLCALLAALFAYNINAQTLSPKPPQTFCIDPHCLPVSQEWDGLTGSAVSLRNGYALVGSPRAPGALQTGAVYQYRLRDQSKPTPGSLWMALSIIHQGNRSINSLGKSVCLVEGSNLIVVVGAPRGPHDGAIIPTGTVLYVTQSGASFTTYRVADGNAVRGGQAGCLVKATAKLVGYVSCGLNIVSIVRVNYLSTSGEYSGSGKLIATASYPASYGTIRSFSMIDSDFVIGISDSGRVILGSFDITAPIVTVKSTHLRWPSILNSQYSNQNTSLFGYSVSMTKSYIAAGCPGFNQRSGAVILYDMGSLSVWNIILAPEFEEFRYFGASVALYGPYVGVGGPGCGDMFPRCLSGKSYVYHVNGTRLATFQPIDAVVGDNFGVAIDITHNYFIVGADRFYGDRTGFAYVFPATSGSWDGNYVPITESRTRSPIQTKSRSISQSSSAKEVAINENKGQKGNSALVAGTVSGLLGLTAVAIFVAIIWRRKRKENNVESYVGRSDIEQQIQKK